MMTNAKACPECHVVPQRYVSIKWVDGQPRLPKAPWICASCGAFAVIDLRTGTLAATTDAEWEPVRERNPGLWALMTSERDRIRRQTP
jgi:hypothetical protein